MIQNKDVSDNYYATYNTYQPSTSNHGSRYQDLAKNNPYANVDYRESWWQKILRDLGFRTNKDAYLESMALQAKEYDNALMQKEYDEEYNSPIAQAMRERAAGLNPDLAGNIDSGSASPLGDDGNPPIAPEADDLSIVQTFGAGVLNAVQAAFGLYGQIQTLKGTKIANESNMMNLVKDAWSMIIPDIYENRNDLESGRIDISNYYNTLKKHYGNTMSKKQFSNFVNRVNTFANSAEGWNMVYDTQSKKAKSRKSMFQEFAGDSYSEWDDIMMDIGDVLGNLAFRINKKSLENTEKYENDVRPKELENKEYYEEALDPVTRAKLDTNPDELTITSNQARASDLNIEQMEYGKMLRGSFEKIMKKLDERADKGNKFAGIAKAVLSVWLMGLMPSIPSISKSSTSGIGLNGTPYSKSSISIK